MPELSSFNIIDILFFAIILISILVGIGRGFVKEVVSILTLIAAIVVAMMFAHRFADYLLHLPSIQHMFASHESQNQSSSIIYLAYGLSFVILFFGTMIIGALVAYFLTSLIQVSMLGGVNRLFGAAFGFARGLLWSVIIVFFVQFTSYREDPTWQASKVVKAVQPAVDWLAYVTSPALEKLKESMGKGLNDDVKKEEKKEAVEEKEITTEMTTIKQGE